MLSVLVAWATKSREIVGNHRPFRSRGQTTSAAAFSGDRHEDAGQQETLPRRRLVADFKSDSGTFELSARSTAPQAQR